MFYINVRCECMVVHLLYHTHTHTHCVMPSGHSISQHVYTYTPVPEAPDGGVSDWTQIGLLPITYCVQTPFT